MNGWRTSFFLGIHTYLYLYLISDMYICICIWYLISDMYIYIYICICIWYQFDIYIYIYIDIWYMYMYMPMSMYRHDCICTYRSNNNMIFRALWKWGSPPRHGHTRYMRRSSDIFLQKVCNTKKYNPCIYIYDF
jgi:hypothetical protein